MEEDDPLLFQQLETVQSAARSNQVATTEIKAADPELQAIIKTLAKAQAEFAQAIEALRGFLKAPEDQGLLDGPEGFIALRLQSEETIRQFLAQRQVYFEKHELFRPVPKGEVEKPDEAGR